MHSLLGNWNKGVFYLIFFPPYVKNFEGDIQVSCKTIT
jgi:hypothetical protein